MILSFISGEITKNLIQLRRMVNIRVEENTCHAKIKDYVQRGSVMSEMGLDAQTGVARKAKENRELGGYLNTR